MKGLKREKQQVSFRIINPGRILAFLWVVAVCSQLVLQQSCKKKEKEDENLYLTVKLSGSGMQNESYYSLNYTERSVELEFSQPIDSLSINGNISFSDRNGSLDSMCRSIAYGRKVILAFKPGFRLDDGWKYKIILKTGLRSTSGSTLPSLTPIELRTSSRHLGIDNDSVSRNSIVCISDIHMGDPRSVTLGYCWFAKNAQALESLLNVVMTSQQVKQLVILGDLFDEWVVPYRLSPFDSLSGINNSRDYFLSVANAPTNINIINKLKAIASGGTTQLIYIPGNHDMLLTEEVLEEIIPGIIWQGDSPGLGHYSPLSGIIMEHGHRYDFFNCPQPLTTPGHMLPPGYFISRLDAEGLMEKRHSALKDTRSMEGDAEFMTAWTSTETGNGLPVSMPVLMAILDGSIDLSFTAAYEYMQTTAPTQYRIVVFGHTHNPMLKVYPAGNIYTGIYANTGSWVNAELSSKPVRTFLVIKPGEWTGSDLDVVSLFQHNLDSGSGSPNPDFTPVLISEESIDK